jgi:hypothetical protein
MHISHSSSFLLIRSSSPWLYERMGALSIGGATAEKQSDWYAQLPPGHAAVPGSVMVQPDAPDTERGATVHSLVPLSGRTPSWA